MFLEFFILKLRTKKLLKNRFGKSDLILDVGCGEKPKYHEHINGKIICLDIKHSNHTHIVSDAMHLPLKKQKFDGLVCINSLYYYENPFHAIKEFSHALKKKGKLLLITPFIYPIHDAPLDKYRFTEFGIRELLKYNFDIKEIRTIGGIFNIPSVMIHSLIKGLPMMTPRPFKSFVRLISFIILIIPYIIAQILSTLDFLDRSRRWPTQYFTYAIKK